MLQHFQVGCLEYCIDEEIKSQDISFLSFSNLRYPPSTSLPLTIFSVQPCPHSPSLKELTNHIAALRLRNSFAYDAIFVFLSQVPVREHVCKRYSSTKKSSAGKIPWPLKIWFYFVASLEKRSYFFFFCKTAPTRRQAQWGIPKAVNYIVRHLQIRAIIA